MYKLIFTDGTVESGMSKNSTWNKLGEGKLIKSMIYQYTFSHQLMLQGYEEYNHLVEKMAIVGQENPVMTKIFVMGRANGNTDIFTIDLKTRQVSKKTVAVGQEYNGQQTTGWKKGLLATPGSDVGHI